MEEPDSSIGCSLVKNKFTIHDGELKSEYSDPVVEIARKTGNHREPKQQVRDDQTVGLVNPAQTSMKGF